MTLIICILSFVVLAQSVCFLIYLDRLSKQNVSERYQLHERFQRPEMIPPVPVLPKAFKPADGEIDPYSEQQELEYAAIGEVNPIIPSRENGNH